MIRRTGVALATLALSVCASTADSPNGNATGQGESSAARPAILDGQTEFTDAEFSAADKRLLVRMFGGVAVYHSDGTEQLKIGFSSVSTYGLDEDSEQYRYHHRSQDLSAAHEQLKTSDSKYLETWRRASAEILDRVDARTTQRAGRMIAYPIVLRSGILHAILDQAGPTTVTEVPEEHSRISLWGTDSEPFFHGRLADDVTYPESMLRFRYCRGMRSSASKGLTVEGGDDDPYVRAYNELYTDDIEFRKDLDRITVSIMEKAAKIGLYDHAAGPRLTREWRQLMMQGGDRSIAARIEERVKRNSRASSRAGTEIGLGSPVR